MKYPVDIALEKYNNRMDVLAEGIAKKIVSEETSVLKEWANRYSAASAEKIYAEVSSWVVKRLQEHHDVKRLFKTVKGFEARREMGDFAEGLDKDLLAKGVSLVRTRVIDELTALTIV